MAKAKTKKQEVKKVALNFNNIAKANAVFNETEQDTNHVLVLRCDKSTFYKFKALHYDFITQAKGIEWDATSTKDYFQFILVEFKKHLVKENLYAVADDNFAKHLNRKGRRPTGERTVAVKDAVHTTLGPFKNSDIKEIHLNICYSLSLLDKHEHFFEYSYLYFFYDIFNFIKSNNKRLIKENR